MFQMYEVIKIKCRYFKEEECDSKVISDKQCSNCLSSRSITMMVSLHEKIDAMNKPAKLTGRKKKTTVTGSLK